MSAFQPSKLGTKEHWDGVYNEEMKNFEEIGDEGEIWFGEDSMEKMVQWSLRNAPPSRRVLEVGSGNGLLLCELAKNRYDPSRLSGIDYSPGSITLSRQVAKSRGFDGITFRLCDFLSEDPLRISDMQEEGSVWDLLLDKGTFDAIALAEKDIFGQSPSDMYPARVSRLLRPGGLFLITCPYMTPVASLSVDIGEYVACNFTEEELKSKFLVAGTGLTYHSRIQHKTYSYGGKSGSVCSSVAFQKSD